MTLAEILALAVVWVAVPLNWLVATILVRLARRSPDVWVLRVQAVAWVSLSIIVTVFAVVFLNNGMAEPILDAEATRLLTRSTLLVFSVIPAAYWLSHFRRRRR